MAKLIEIDSTWYDTNPFYSKLPKELSQNQIDLLTPVLLSVTTVASVRKSFVEFFTKTGVLTSPLSFRYSYSVTLKGKRGITIVPKYHLEKDLNTLLNDYKIVTHVDSIIPTGAKWESEAYDTLSFFTLKCHEASHKLVKTRVGDTYVGYEAKEPFKDRPVR